MPHLNKDKENFPQGHTLRKVTRMGKVSRCVVGITSEGAGRSLHSFEGIFKVSAKHKEILSWMQHVQQDIWVLEGVMTFVSLTLLSQNSGGHSVLLSGMLLATLGNTFSSGRTSCSLKAHLCSLGTWVPVAPQPPYGSHHCTKTSSHRSKCPKRVEGCNTGLGEEPHKMACCGNSQGKWLNDLTLGSPSPPEVYPFNPSFIHFYQKHSRSTSSIWILGSHCSARGWLEGRLFSSL